MLNFLSILGIFKKNPEQISGTEDAFENVKSSLFDRRNILYIFLITIIVSVVVAGLSIIPLNGYKRDFEKKFKAAGLNVIVKGSANLNLFFLRYELKNVEISTISDFKNEHGYRARIVASNINVSFLSGRISIIDANAVFSKEKERADFNEFMNKLFSSRDLNIVFQNLQISMSFADVLEMTNNAITISKNSKKNNDIFFSELLTLKELSVFSSKTKLNIEGSVYINDVLFRIVLHKASHSFDLRAYSSNINIILNFSKKSKSAIIGKYKINSENFGKFLSTIRNDDSDFIGNLTRDMSLNIAGEIFSEDKVNISSSGTITTSYGNGYIKTNSIENKPLDIQIGFDEIFGNNYLITKKEGKYDLFGIDDFLFRILAKINHSFDLNIKKIKTSHSDISNISFVYLLENKMFTAKKFDAVIFNNNIQSGTISLISKDSQKINDVKFKFGVSGKNFENLMIFSDNIILPKLLFFNSDSQEMKDASYDGYVELQFGTDCDFGISDLAINLDNNRFIGGYYLIKRPNYNGGEIFSYSDIGINLKNINLNNILNIDLQKSAFEYIFRVRDLRDNSDLYNKFFSGTFLNYSNDIKPFKISANFENDIFYDYPITGSINIDRKNKSIIFSSNMANSKIFSGSLSFSITAKKLLPEILINAQLDKFDLGAVDDILSKIYNVNIEKSDIFGIFKRGIYLPNMSDITTTIDLDVKRFSGAVFDMKNFDLSINGIGNEFIINKISGDVVRGDDVVWSFVLAGNVKNKAKIDHNISFKILGLDLSYMLDSSIKKENIATGKIILDGNISTFGNNFYDIIFYANGTMSVKMRDMYWSYMDFVTLSKKLLTSKRYDDLDINKILLTGKKMFFQDAGGDIVISNGILKTGGIVLKGSGVSGLLKFSIDLLESDLQILDGSFLILGRDPRAGKNYLSIPIAFKATGKFSSISSQLYVDRVQEYIDKMYKIQKDDEGI